MTRRDNHEGQKPLIQSMTGSSCLVGVGEGTLWIPDEFNQGGSIRFARRGGEVRVGGKPVSFWRVPSPWSFSLYISFFHPSDCFVVYLPFSVFLTTHLDSFSELTVTPSYSVFSSLACDSPEGGTLAKQGIWGSEANLLRGKHRRLQPPSQQTQGLTMRVSTGHIQQTAFQRDYCWYEPLTVLNWKPAWRKMAGQRQRENSRFCAPAECFWLHSLKSWISTNVIES